VLHLLVFALLGFALLVSRRLLLLAGFLLSQLLRLGHSLLLLLFMLLCLLALLWTQHLVLQLCLVFLRRLWLVLVLGLAKPLGLSTMPATSSALALLMEGSGHFHEAAASTDHTAAAAAACAAAVTTINTRVPSLVSNNMLPTALDNCQLQLYLL
jgi:hypothetical protein